MRLPTVYIQLFRRVRRKVTVSILCEMALDDGYKLCCDLRARGVNWFVGFTRRDNYPEYDIEFDEFPSSDLKRLIQQLNCKILNH